MRALVATFQGRSLQFPPFSYIEVGQSSVVLLALRRYSHDLPQGGLEVPCTLVFEGNSKYTKKVKGIVEKALKPTNEAETLPPAQNKGKLKKINGTSDQIKDDVPDMDYTTDSQAWIQDGGIALSIIERDIISKGDRLNYKIINIV